MAKTSKYFLFLALLIFLAVGVVIVTEQLIQVLQVTGEDLLQERRNAQYTTADEKTRPLKRVRGPRVWTTLTKQWGPETPVSKRNEFPGYNDPIPRTGYIKGRRSKTKSSVGSAIAISPNGVWLTAKHVVENCKKIFVQAGLKNGKPAGLTPSNVMVHRGADVAVITLPRTDYNRTPFSVSEAVRRPSDAYHIGFPNGKPGAVHSRYIGRMKVRRGYKKNSREDLLVWAETTRIPDFSGSLGGISGGATVDHTGALIGINSAASVRRGRILTSRSAVFLDFLRRNGHGPLIASTRRPAIAELTSDHYPRYAKAAIQDRRVVRVICRRGR